TWSCHHLLLRSVPTRRSSDLVRSPWTDPLIFILYSLFASQFNTSQFPRKRRQYFSFTIFVYIDFLFNADTAITGDIYTGFYGEQHAFLGYVFIEMMDGRGFVNFDAESMTDSVVEVFAVAVLLDDIPGSDIEFFQRYTGP